MKFEIDPAYLTSVTEHRVYQEYSDRDSVTADELIDILRNPPVKIESYTSIDHPVFTQLREQLESEGYIRVERGWWNGDRVIRSFFLNGFKFNPGDQFSCASALGTKFKIRDRHKYLKKQKKVADL